MKPLARSRKLRFTPAILALALLLAALPTANAQSMPAPPATAPAGAAVVLTTTVEEGKKQLVATVTLNGKPVEKATVTFGVLRSFGTLVVGQDTTLDDGTAAVTFPASLPAGTAGELQIVAQVTAPPAIAGARTQTSFPGGQIVSASVPFGRALWAPQAPIGLIAVIMLLLAGAWGAYLFVAVQLVAIKKGASQ